MKKLGNILSIFLTLTVLFASASAYTFQFADDAKTIRLRWKNNVIPIAISSSLFKSPNIRPNSDVEGAIRRSLATWEEFADITFEIVSSDKLSVSPTGIYGDGVSLVTIAQTPENLLLFGSEPETVSARTRVFSNRRGFIAEADIVLNPYQQFSTGGEIGTFDLEATLTHEIGHLLGLEHSTVTGATMQAAQGKNGIYQLPQSISRTLSEDDIAGIGALYGAKNIENCCGGLNGKINFPAKSVFQVWLENASGEIAAGVLSKPNGNFVFEGLKGGKYQLFAQDFGKQPKFAATHFGEVLIEKGKISTVEKRFAPKSKSFNLRLIGFNGQLSKVSVPLNAGKSFTVYIGGDNINPEDFTFSFNSPFIKTVPNTMAIRDYGEDISVLSFDISVNSAAPFGEYSLKAQKNNGECEYFVGAVTVGQAANPWTSGIFSNLD